MSRKTTIAIVLGAVLFASGVAAFVYIRTPKLSYNSCVNNLRQIDEAKQQWALENKKTTNDVPTIDEIRPFLGRGLYAIMPQCPQGGVYTIGRVADSPSCSVHGSLTFIELKYIFRTPDGHHSCYNNLRQIDLAKQLWALEYKKTTNDVSTMEDIRGDLGRGPEGIIPQCPKGGIYKIGRIGEPPSCSVDGS